MIFLSALILHCQAENSREQLNVVNNENVLSNLSLMSNEKCSFN